MLRLFDVFDYRLIDALSRIAVGQAFMLAGIAVVLSWVGSWGRK